MDVRRGRRVARYLHSVTGLHDYLLIASYGHQGASYGDRGSLDKVDTILAPDVLPEASRTTSTAMPEAVTFATDRPMIVVCVEAGQV